MDTKQFAYAKAKLEDLISQAEVLNQQIRVLRSIMFDNVPIQRMSNLAKSSQKAAEQLESTIHQAKVITDKNMDEVKKAANGQKKRPELPESPEPIIEKAQKIDNVFGVKRGYRLPDIRDAVKAMLSNGGKMATGEIMQKLGEVSLIDLRDKNDQAYGRAMLQRMRDSELLAYDKLGLWSLASQGAPESAEFEQLVAEFKTKAAPAPAKKAAKPKSKQSRADKSGGRR